MGPEEMHKVHTRRPQLLLGLAPAVLLPDAAPRLSSAAVSVAYLVLVALRSIRLRRSLPRPAGTV